MKKAIITLLVFLMVITSVFAAEDSGNGDWYNYNTGEFPIDFTFHPGLARYGAMGRSGLALTTRLDSFFVNPAALAKKGFALAIPSATISVYNLSAALNDSKTVEIIDKLTHGNATNADTAKLAVNLLGNLGRGRNLIATMDASIAMKVGIFGLATNMQVKLHGLNTGSSMLSQSIIPEVNLAQTVGLGFRILNFDSVSLSVGASVHAIYKAYLKGIDANTIVGLIGGTEETNPTELLLWDTPIVGGFAVPIDVGVNVGFFNNALVLGTTLSNINGKYYMNSYGSAGDLVNSLSTGAMAPPEGHQVAASEKFTIGTPLSFNIGLAFAPRVPVLRPVLTVDFVDIIDLFTSDNFQASDILLHMNFGAEFGLWDVLTVRGGVDRGYISLGAGFWLPFMEIDVAYGRQEFGDEIGDKPVDALTIKFSLGYDKK